ncbi:protein kinase domain-containing protein [Legionella spiritensis]|uniref:Serine/threonine protein kinase n=1 Tax=Legionella spiritensis TaxID=452 RepID=A0A0W0YYZ0_LEGSP|nr:protein kinase [Legionella spiritensis]KTD62087.1 serine/threonine protein kinase [Legionella spiritensis]SNV39556.1 serine/threonine protein kinase [Legionella spiritensis]
MRKIKARFIKFEIKNKRFEKKVNEAVLKIQKQLSHHNKLVEDYNYFGKGKSERKRLFIELKKSSESISLLLDPQIFLKYSNYPEITSYYYDLQNKLIDFNNELSGRIRKYNVGFDEIYGTNISNYTCKNLFEFLFFKANRNHIIDFYMALKNQAYLYKSYKKGWENLAEFIKYTPDIPDDCKRYIRDKMDKEEFNIDDWSLDLADKFHLSDEVYNLIKNIMNDFNFLKQENIILKERLTENLFQDIPFIMKTLGNSEIKFLGGGNAFNFKVTNLDNNESFVIKLNPDQKSTLISQKLLETDAKKYISKPYYRDYIGIEFEDFDISHTSSNLELLDYYENGDIASYGIHQDEINIDEACFIFTQLADFISILEREDIFFPDMKIANFLLDKNMLINVSDTKSFVKTDSTDYDLCKTEGYVPPEFIYNDEINIPGWHSYCLGIGLYCYLTQTPTKDIVISKFDFNSLLDENGKLKFNAKHSSFKGAIGQQFKDLIERLLNEDPRLRPTMSQVKSELESLHVLVNRWHHKVKHRVNAPSIIIGTEYRLFNQKKVPDDEDQEINMVSDSSDINNSLIYKKQFKSMMRRYSNIQSDLKENNIEAMLRNFEYLRDDIEKLQTAIHDDFQCKVSQDIDSDINSLLVPYPHSMRG